MEKYYVFLLSTYIRMSLVIWLASSISWGESLSCWGLVILSLTTSAYVPWSAFWTLKQLTYDISHLLRRPNTQKLLYHDKPKAYRIWWINTIWRESGEGQKHTMKHWGTRLVNERATLEVDIQHKLPSADAEMSSLVFGVFCYVGTENWNIGR